MCYFVFTQMYASIFERDPVSSPGRQFLIFYEINNNIAINRRWPLYSQWRPDRPPARQSDLRVDFVKPAQKIQYNHDLASMRLWLLACSQPRSESLQSILCNSSIDSTIAGRSCLLVVVASCRLPQIDTKCYPDSIQGAVVVTGAYQGCKSTPIRIYNPNMLIPLSSFTTISRCPKNEFFISTSIIRNPSSLIQAYVQIRRRASTPLQHSLQPHKD